MKLATVEIYGERRLAALVGAGMIELAAGGFPASMEAFLEAGPETWRKARAWLETPGSQKPDPIFPRLLTPLSRPGKIIGIGMNYRDHVNEQNAKMPDHPIVFAKFATSLSGPGDEIIWDPKITSQVDWEAELGIVIGRRVRNVSEEEALDCVFGYTIINDVSARDLQFSERQWVRAKSLDTFCPVGPVIVTTDELPDPGNLRIRSRVNGATMQDSNTSDLIFGVKHLVSFLSRSFTLEPGDLIATGTPSGVGFARKPPVFLQDGDRVEIEIDRIGVLENVCRVIQ